MSLRGPLVRPPVHYGAALFVVGSTQFVIAMAVLARLYPGYSITQNPISDLGGPHAPYPRLFDFSVALLGVLGLAGTPLLRSALAPRRSRAPGLGLLMLAELGAVLVGVFPEGSPQLGGHVHDAAADLAFVAAGLALLVLPFAMLRDTRWEGGYRAFTWAAGLVTVTAIVLATLGVYGPLGPGGTERLIVAPILAWAIVAGLHLLRLPSFSSRSQPVRTEGAPG